MLDEDTGIIFISTTPFCKLGWWQHPVERSITQSHRSGGAFLMEKNMELKELTDRTLELFGVTDPEQLSSGTHCSRS